MMRWVQPEINAPTSGNVLLVGRDPGAQEMAKGRPFVGQAGKELDSLLDGAGIARKQINIANVVGVQPPGNEFSRHRREDVALGLQHLDDLVLQLQPSVIVAMGNEASWAMMPSTWPCKASGIFSASGIQERRGYLWGPTELTLRDHKVLTTLHPSAVMRDRSGVSEMLVVADLAKAWSERHTLELVRPCMQVELVRTAGQAIAAAAAIRAADIVACDIEITRTYPFKCLCVGFAISAQHAYVFTPSVLGYAFALLEKPSLHTLWQNAQFDLHFLLTRHNVRVAGRVDDTIVAWHTRWPEIAGAKTDLQGNKKAGIRRTRKSLLFFGSLFSKAAFWKDYDVDEEGMFTLCGKDCCITRLAWDEMFVDVLAMNLWHVYEMTRRRIWPVVEMQARGLLVDEQLRRERIRQLSERRATLMQELQLLAQPLLEEHRERLCKPQLIWRRETCACCRNGKSKRAACTSCSGLKPSAKVADLRAMAAGIVRKSGEPPTQKAALLGKLPAMRKKELEALVLKPCKQCEGAGQWEVYAFNPASNEQIGMLLFDALKLPRRESVDETSLKGLLGWLSGEMPELQALGAAGAS